MWEMSNSSTFVDQTTLDASFNMTTPPGEENTTNFLASSVGYPRDSDDSQAKDSLAFFNFIVNVYVDGFVCLLGYFGNVMTVIVLHKDKVKTSNSVLLQALAVFDCLFLTYVVLYVVLRTLASYTGALEAYSNINPYIVALVLPFGWTSQTSTIWMVTLIAIDRYMVVCHPLKAIRYNTQKNARRAVIIMTISALLFNAPRWPRYYFVAFSDSSSSNATFVSHISFNVEGWDEALYRDIYHIGLTVVFLFIIPLTILIVLNTRLMFTIKHASKLRRELTNNTTPSSGKSQKSESNITLMMVIVISIFILCELPDFIASVIGAAKFTVDPIIYSYYAAVKEFMLVLNSAINFYIYCIFYDRFRETLLAMLGLQKKPSLSSSLSSIVTATKTSTNSLASSGASVNDNNDNARV